MDKSINRFIDLYKKEKSNLRKEGKINLARAHQPSAQAAWIT
jgi:hypothetical protein